MTIMVLLPYGMSIILIPKSKSIKSMNFFCITVYFFYKSNKLTYKILYYLNVTASHSVAPIDSLNVVSSKLSTSILKYV